MYILARVTSVSLSVCMATECNYARQKYPGGDTFSLEKTWERSELIEDVLNGITTGLTV